MKRCILFLTVLVAFGQAACAYDPLGLNLPGTPVSLTDLGHTSDAYISVVLGNVPDGFDVSDGTYKAWCSDPDDYIYRGVTYTHTMLYSSYDDSLPWYVADDDWDKVNYIVNKFKDGTYTGCTPTNKEIQAAIWYFMPRDHSVKTYTDSEGWAVDWTCYQHVVDDANANGEGFWPGSGDYVGVVADNGENVQVVFIEIQYFPAPEFVAAALLIGLLAPAAGYLLVKR